MQSKQAKNQRKAKRSLLGTLLRNLPSHIAFLIALAIIQTLYTVLFFSAAHDLYLTRQTVTQSYDYELEYRGMTQPQYVELYNECGTEPTAAPESEAYRAIRYEKMPDGSYNAYISLKGASPRRAAAYFLEEHGLYDLAPGYSPLYDYRAEYLPDIFAFLAVATLAVFALSLFLLMQLYRMRLDRDTFDYAIYMTCGATYRRLYWRSCRELLALSLLTLLPALLLGSSITIALYAARGVALHYSTAALLLVLLFTLLTVLAAVRIPMHRLSKKPPVALLRARDNSNHATSPRRSLRIFGASFPRDLELISLWRYRRYLIGLMVSAVLLPTLFTTAMTLSDIYEKRQASPAPDFTVTFSPEVVDADTLNQNTAALSEEILSVEGVSMCLPEQLLCPVTMLGSHMLLQEDHTHGAASVTVYYDRPLNRADADLWQTATNYYNYAALDEAAITALQRQYTDIEGDLSSVLRDDKTVVITESVSSTKMFNFAPGDKILIATTAAIERIEAVGLVDLKQILMQQLDCGSFGYEEYTVGAVIHDVTANDRLLVGVNFNEYEALTLQPPVRYSLDVYLQKDADFDTWERVGNAVYAAAYGYYHCSVKNNDVFFDRYTTSLSNLQGRLRVLAVSFLLMMPLILFFSQRVFYRKREKEWDMLRALGATRTEILQSNLISGLVTALAALALTVPCVLICDRLLFSLFNRYLPAGGFITTVVLRYEFPWISLAIASVLSLICGFLPPLLAGLRYRARCRARTVSLMAGE